MQTAAKATPKPAPSGAWMWEKDGRGALDQPVKKGGKLTRPNRFQGFEKEEEGTSASAARARRSTCTPQVRWLLIIDNGPIREATLAQYHLLEKKVMGLRAQLDAFESGDLPAYQRWEARTFGPLLTELRSMLQAIDEKQRLLAEIEDEMTWTGCSAAAAYRRVTEAANAPAREDEGSMTDQWTRKKWMIRNFRTAKGEGSLARAICPLASTWTVLTAPLHRQRGSFVPSTKWWRGCMRT